jgi:hypothetical protein
VSNAENRILDAGHFALDAKPDEITASTGDFLHRALNNATPGK